MKFGRRGPADGRRSSGAPPLNRTTRRRGDAARPINAARTARPWPSALGRWRTGTRRLTPPRAAAILVILAAAGSIYGLAATPAFTLARVDLPTLRWTSPAALAEAVATPVGTNLFRVRTGPIEDRLRKLPGVAGAQVTVSLPDALVVRVQERKAIVVWEVGQARFLVDRDGVIFAALDANAAATSDLTVIADSRPESATLGFGSIIDPVDLDAATRLGSITAADIGSRASSLVVAVTEANGFVVGTVPRSWIAIFGLYTPTLRTPTMIPGQVRLLRSLLAGREDTVGRIILSDADSGTYVPKASGTP